MQKTRYKEQGTRRKIQNPKNKIQKKRNKAQGARDKAQEPKPNKQNPKNKIVYYNSAVVVVRKVNRRFVGLFDNLNFRNNNQYTRNLL